MRVLCSDIRDFKVWWYSNSLKTFNVSIILEEKIRRPYELHPHGLSAWRVLGQNEKHREREDPGLKNNPIKVLPERQKIQGARKRNWSKLHRKWTWKQSKNLLVSVSELREKDAHLTQYLRNT
jgi:hypothetical protein